MTGCGMKEPQASTDIFELKKLVQVSLPMKSVQWEVLKWPYDDGFLPSSTETITLVAEFEPTDPKWIDIIKEPIETERLAPESGRTWMSQPFKTMLAAEYVDIKKFHCGRYKTKFTKTGNPVDGFVCESNGRGLLYLDLLDSSSKVDGDASVPEAAPATGQKK